MAMEDNELRERREVIGHFVGEWFDAMCDEALGLKLPGELGPPAWEEIKTAVLRKLVIVEFKCEMAANN